MALVNTDQVTAGTVQDFQNLKDAQQDMRAAYLHGYPGVFVSGTAWPCDAGDSSQQENRHP